MDNDPVSSADLLMHGRLAMVAYRQVLSKKQANYKEVIAWLEAETLGVMRQKGLDHDRLLQVVTGSRASHV
jgi:hypothetical protein